MSTEAISEKDVNNVSQVTFQKNQRIEDEVVQEWKNSKKSDTCVSDKQKFETYYHIDVKVSYLIINTKHTQNIISC